MNERKLILSPREVKQQRALAWLESTRSPVLAPMAVCFSGPSGGGKSRLRIETVKAFSSRSEFVCSYTTRPLRPHETEGVDYRSVTPNAFAHLEKAGKFLECEHIKSDLSYGTPLEPVTVGINAGKLLIFDVSVWGEKALRQHPLLDGRLFSIFVDAPDEVLEARLRARYSEDRLLVDEREVARRLARAPKERSEKDHFDLWIDNDGRTPLMTLMTRIVGEIEQRQRHLDSGEKMQSFGRILAI